MDLSSLLFPGLLTGLAVIALINWSRRSGSRRRDNGSWDSSSIGPSDDSAGGHHGHGAASSDCNPDGGDSGDSCSDAGGDGGGGDGGGGDGGGGGD